jgi:DNA-binding NtrC family response regulator
MTPHILAVDDEPGWLSYLKKAFDVEIASDLDTTMALLRQKSFDLIITSSRRLDVLKSISEKYPEKRVIVATGQPTTQEAIKTYRLGALDYFPKDFRPEVISAKIHEAIQKPLKSSYASPK